MNCTCVPLLALWRQLFWELQIVRQLFWQQLFWHQKVFTAGNCTSVPLLLSLPSALIAINRSWFSSLFYLLLLFALFIWFLFVWCTSVGVYGPCIYTRARSELPYATQVSVVVFVWRLSLIYSLLVVNYKTLWGKNVDIKERCLFRRAVCWLSRVERMRLQIIK